MRETAHAIRSEEPKECTMSSDILYTDSEISSSPSAFSTRFAYDSDWVAANNSINTSLIFKHNLKCIPYPLCLFFSPDQEAVYPLIWNYYGPNAGNPVSIKLDQTKVTLSIGSGIPLHGYFDPQTGGWTYWRSGFFRVTIPSQ
ncbi:hypothetical protein DF122_29795 [Burkholderia pseudomallei]|nr:hypothetical protein [Burkholderia pseudomallei]PNW96939.1 hypothetical protein CF649_28540 [Burkholderia sp. 136(2017)]PNX11685.1 hypothetical protein CF650_29250 [Burkholderia sp. 129]PNX25929.1 hypothetical protein CF647_28440 [Burkholderia sp. 117]PNX34376.1 hypothetical protein CF648_28545 [Burkholderia sp. 137]